jgi:hypothetical protein
LLVSSPGVAQSDELNAAVDCNNKSVESNFKSHIKPILTQQQQQQHHHQKLVVIHVCCEL